MIPNLSGVNLSLWMVDTIQLGRLPSGSCHTHSMNTFSNHGDLDKSLCIHTKTSVLRLCVDPSIQYFTCKLPSSVRLLSKRLFVRKGEL